MKSNILPTKLNSETKIVSLFIMGCLVGKKTGVLSTSFTSCFYIL